MARHIEDVLQSMRSGEVQSDEAIAFFVKGVTDGSVSRPQAAAWLAWAFSRGLSQAETVALTGEMTRSGKVLRWPEGTPLVDKHSTGGVGDKVSLPLAPLWAELGKRVPMLSGRGLGHTGGTLDKLEAIPGYRTDLSEAELGAVLATVGCFITGQTAEVAPADRVLYGLRNETQTVESIPLICGSILSKKLAEGVEELFLDVKCGSGAFMKTREDAVALATTLVAVAKGNGVQAKALVTTMDRPLGRAVGNAVEVIESVECLKGGGPADVRELVLAFADDPRAAEVLDSGKALDRFIAMVEAQGGDARALVDHGRLLGGGCGEVVLEADRDGYVGEVEAIGIGRAVFVLGAGRRRAEDPVDFGVGAWVEVKPGDRVTKGQPLVRLLHRDGHALDEAMALSQGAIKLQEGPPAVPPLILERIG